MKIKRPSILLIMLILMFAMSLVLIFVVPIMGTKYTHSANVDTNQPIEIIGSYQIDDSPFMNLTKDTRFNNGADYPTVTIKGHFSRDIPEGQELLFFIPRLFVSLKIDGNEVYTFGKDGDYPPVYQSPGAAWAYYKSPGISSGSEVELIMRMSYKGSYVNFNTLLGTMQTGTHAELYEQMFLQNGSFLVFCIFFIFIGILALLLAVIAHSLRVPHSIQAVALAFFAANGALLVLFDSNFQYMPLLMSNPTILSISDIVVLYMMPCSYLMCILNYAGQRVRPAVKAIGTMLCAFAFFMFLLQGYGVVQLYEVQVFYMPIAFPMVMTALGIIMYDAFKHNNKAAKLMLLTMLPTFIGGAIDMFNFFFPFMSLRILFATGVSMTLVLQTAQIIYMIKRGSDAAKQKLQLENELIQSHVAVMLSQIQPHFLYNSLAAIQRLCTKDPKLAEEAVIQFSIYLRGNMKSLTYKKTIPFEQELVHLENYLALEKKRFGDKLNIVYDISVSNFYLPALTVQPIAENAVRHGITKRDEESGTLTISTSENKTDIVITITDNGVGFDTSKTKNDGREHIGIKNVRSRLASMCGGTITVHSEPDIGTTAIIKIPKGDL